jgi:RNA polymerase sigma-70 factor (ECF subfamily)
MNNPSAPSGPPGAPATADAAARAQWDSARAAWPGVEVPLAVFAPYLAARRTGPEPTAERTAELYLACACASGVPAALAAFEQRFLSHVPAFLGRLALPDSTLTEVKQLLRAKLFVSTGPAPAKIAEYTGQGALLGWLRVVAMRTAISLLRQRSDKPLADLGGDDQVMAVTEDPELTYLRGRYQSEFKEAFAAALAQLKSEQRNLLRLHLVEGMNIDKLGVMFQIHRATAARWLHSAREAVFTETRRLLQARLRLSPAEFDSLVRVLRSQLDLSVARLLVEPAR